VSERQNIVIVPGLHPMTPESLQYDTYRAATARWSKDEFDVHILQVGWHRKGETTETQQARLQEGLEYIEGPIWGIGVSAGGLALIGAMEANEDKIPMVVTVASPLNVPESALDQLRSNRFKSRFIPASLEGHYRTANTYLQNVAATAPGRIVSFHGRKDTRVPLDWSVCDPPMQSFELPGRKHGYTILGGLALHRDKILAPFREAAEE